MNELDRIIKDLSESIEDDQKYMEEEFETVRNYCIKREFQKDGDCMEKLLKEVEELNSNTPDGVIRDADTIIIDAIQKNDFEITGIAEDIFNIWKNSSDKKAVEQMFFEFTDMEFKDFLEKCKDEITR